MFKTFISPAETPPFPQGSHAIAGAGTVRPPGAPGGPGVPGCDGAGESKRHGAALGTSGQLQRGRPSQAMAAIGPGKRYGAKHQKWT